MPTKTFNSLLKSVKACRLCEAELDHGVRPVLQIDPRARILIAGQAPGSKVHATGIPFDDPSGNRLRDWMGVGRDTFYDQSAIAILPMGFCYPGKGRSGDLPPIPRCAQTWRQELMDQLVNIQLTLVIGKYAFDWHLENTQRTLTETVRNWRQYEDSGVIPMPHPSPRNNIWLKKNPWYEEELVPVVKQKVQCALL